MLRKQTISTYNLEHDDKGVVRTDDKSVYKHVSRHSSNYRELMRIIKYV